MMATIAIAQRANTYHVPNRLNRLRLTLASLSKFKCMYVASYVRNFRIKIWDKASSAVVYDNQMNSSEDSSDATAISGGSIVVHDTKCKTSSSPTARTSGTESTETVQVIEELSIEAYPNPIKSSLSLKLGNPNNDRVSIQMLDLSGRSMIMNNSAPTSDGIYQLDTESLQSGLYILRVTVGNYVKTLKLMKE